MLCSFLFSAYNINYKNNISSSFNMSMMVLINLINSVDDISKSDINDINNIVIIRNII